VTAPEFNNHTRPAANTTACSSATSSIRTSSPSRFAASLFDSTHSWHTRHKCNRFDGALIFADREPPIPRGAR
jgi:hypothetical protein